MLLPINFWRRVGSGGGDVGGVAGVGVAIVYAPVSLRWLAYGAGRD
jgi:hypothetical protein